MKIEILGSGCAKCKKLAKMVEVAAKELQLESEIVKITEITEIMAFGIMVTPALAIDGQVKFSGRLPSAKELNQYLSE